MGKARKRKQQARAQTRDIQTILAVLTPAVRAEVLTVYKPDSCIASVNVLQRALMALEIPADPVATRVAIFNAAFARRAAEAGRMPQTKDELATWIAQDNAWSVAIGYEPPVGFGANDARMHLVCLVGGTWLADPSLDQASRPERALQVAPHVMRLSHRWQRSGQQPVELGPPGTRSIVLYTKAGDITPQRWQASSSWTNPANPRLAERALRRCGLVVRAGAPGG